MSATLGLNSLKFQFIGKKVKVPDNNIAKLMYYLDVVTKVIQHDENNRLTDYENYYQLNDKEREAVYKLALAMNPNLFIESGIFVVNPDLVPEGNINDFLKITDERVGIHVNEEIIIGGKSVKVLKIMVCKKIWIDKYYNIPIAEITNEIKNRNRRVQISQNPPAQTEDQMIRRVPYSNAIIINQVQPRNFLPTQLGTGPTSLICPFCFVSVNTVTTSEFNCASCCLCFWIGCLCYFCIQSCRNKSLCCQDIIHRCPNCGSFLGRNDAC